MESFDSESEFQTKRKALGERENLIKAGKLSTIWRKSFPPENLIKNVLNKTILSFPFAAFPLRFTSRVHKLDYTLLLFY